MTDLEYAERRKAKWDAEVKLLKQGEVVDREKYPDGYAIKVREGRNGYLIFFGALGILLTTAFIIMGSTALIDLKDNGILDGIVWNNVLNIVALSTWCWFISFFVLLMGIFSGKVKYKIVKPKR